MSISILQINELGIIKKFEIGITRLEDAHRKINEILVEDSSIRNFIVFKCSDIDTFSIKPSHTLFSIAIPNSNSPIAYDIVMDIDIDRLRSLSELNPGSIPMMKIYETN